MLKWQSEDYDNEFLAEGKTLPPITDSAAWKAFLDAREKDRDIALDTPNLFPIIARIAPKDKRFAEAVLKSIVVPFVPRPLTVRPGDGVGQISEHGLEPRLFGLAQLDVIEAETADKGEKH